MEKFYQNGLQFSCTGCGECCRLPGGRVELTLPEALSIAAYLNLSLYDFLEQYCITDHGNLKLKDDEKQHCIFLQEDQCRVYGVRPLQCRSFPFWPENLKSRYRWNQLKSFCPGINEGENHSFEEIEFIRRAQRDYDRDRKLEISRQQKAPKNR